MTGENVQYDGSTWFHRVKLLQPDGSTKYSTRRGFSTQEEAEISYEKYDAEYKKDVRKYQMVKNCDSEIGLKDYLIYWFEEVFSERIEATTRMIGAYTLYNLIIPNMEQDIKLRYVNSDYLNALLEQASRTCKSAGNKSRELLNIALKEAVTQGYVKDNPVIGTKRYPRTKPEVNILSKGKLKVLLEVASKSNWYLEILLALFCGLRKGEIQGLKFADFDFDKETVTIKRQVTSNPVVPKGQGKITEYTVTEKPPKTENSYRTLRVPEAVMLQVIFRRKTIECYKKKMEGDFMDHDYISCRENGLPHSVTALNLALSKMCSRNGLPHITIHGLRHMYATILMEQGIPLVKISALLGHSSINTTFEYYCDVMDENENIVAFMNNHFIPDGG